MSSDFEPLLSEELLNDFYAESDEHLMAIRKVLSSANTTDPKGEEAHAVAEPLLRSFHSLKGICGIVGLGPAAEIAHQAEDFLRSVFERKSELTEKNFDVLAKAIQHLEQVVAAFRTRQSLPDVGPIVQELAALSPKTPAPAAAPVEESKPAATEGDFATRAKAALAEGRSLWQCVFEPSPTLDQRGVNVSEIRGRLTQSGEILEATPRVRAGGKIAFEFVVARQGPFPAASAWEADGLHIQPWNPQAGVPAAPQGGSASGRSTHADAGSGANAFIAPSHFVRVDLGRLDELMRITGEMVIHRARFEDQINRLGQRQGGVDTRGLQEVNFAFTRQLRDLRDALMRVRLVRMAEIFDRMPFVVRDIARQTGRKIRLVVTGQETELDKYLVERLKDPLLHLVRNAISHGVELPEEREKQNKPAEATITLSAKTQGDWVLVEVADDGRGIDPAGVARRAAEAGMAVPEELDNAALAELLCSPGFSTRDQADLTSGRGFGMSVVSDTLRELGGTLYLKTELGKGTRFTLRLPLTLVITDALILSVGGQTFAIPQALVEEITEMDPAKVQNLDATELLSHRGSVLPLIRVADAFGCSSARRDHYPVLILTTERGRAGLVVDRVLSQREVVVRAMRDPLVQVPGIAGATELGDGKPVLILDASTLARASRRTENGKSRLILEHSYSA